jgi:hypothetical protein
MATALSIFGLAFAAFCVWLIVRVVNRRERWAKWTLAVVIGLPVVYLASFGPARAMIGPRQLLAGPDTLLETYQCCYRPIFWAMENPLIYGALDRYCALWERGRL